MNRRQLLRTAVVTPASLLAYRDAALPRITLGVSGLDETYASAVAVLKGNIQRAMGFGRPVLFEGAEYPGVWLECAPLEGLAYEPLSPEIALNNHEIFFALQRADGYIPYGVKKDRIGSSQIQMAVAIAATAWDLYTRNRHAGFLERAYRACSRWDEWLMRYRNTRGAGLCEAFCTYDTGQDHSPRFRGKPDRCRDDDARLCPKVEGLPYLAPDLSATVYGGRIALASMAKELGRSIEHARWLEAADRIRSSILRLLYDPEDAAFYDRDSSNRFVRIRGDVITRVLGEHVPDQNLFQEIYRLQIGNPRAFWTPYPFPSIAMDDPAFVRPIPRNSWGGAAQALTALRAPRWMEHYGKYAALSHLMRRWVEAIAQARGFYQQMDPQSGEFTVAGAGYSPGALVFFDFVWRLYGVRARNQVLEWNCRLPEGSVSCFSTRSSEAGTLALRTEVTGSRLFLNERQVGDVTGDVRLITNLKGQPHRLVGTADRAVIAVVRRLGTEQRYTIRPDEEIDITRAFKHA